MDQALGTISMALSYDILLYSWRCDSHCCFYLVGVSPARSGWRDVASALPSVEQGKLDLPASTCKSHGFDFIPFRFFHLWLLRPGGGGTPLSNLPAFQVPHWEAHDWVFRRVSFAIIHGVSEQLIDRQLVDLSW